MDKQIVKLKLDIEFFDESPFISALALAQSNEINFSTMQDLGDSENNRRKLYELNKICSADIPERGEFFSYDEFCKRRYGNSYDPAGAIVARHNSKWIGLSVISNWSHKGFVFNEMTGVLRDYRRKGIAITMKILGIRFAKSTDAKVIYTSHHHENYQAIELNKRLGFVDTDWDSLI